MCDINRMLVNRTLGRKSLLMGDGVHIVLTIAVGGDRTQFILTIAGGEIWCKSFCGVHYRRKILLRSNRTLGCRT